MDRAAGDSFQFIASAGAAGNVASLSIAVEGLADGFAFDTLVLGATGATITAVNNGVLEADTTLFFGSARDDTLDDGAGNDVLDGGAGNDVLAGGLGDDLFIFENSDGDDTFTDFDALSATEQIDVSDFGFADTGDFQAINQVGADTVIEVDAGDTITLLGVTAADIDDSDFVF